MINAIVIAPLTYFASAIVCLRGQYDLNDFFELGKSIKEKYTKK